MNVAIIPARGGSRRIPRKNIRPFHGHPIIAYSIGVAHQSGLFDEVWVSTDDPEIGEYAIKQGAKWYPRDAMMSHDHIGTQEVMVDTILCLWPLRGRPEYICCVYATAPMLYPDDLEDGFDLMLREHKYAYVDGWFYWGRTAWFTHGKPLTEGISMPKDERRWIDINVESDWTRAEEMYAALHREAA